MEFQISKEQKMMKDSIKELVEKEIRPYVMEWDEKGSFIPDSLIEKYAEMGMFGITVPQEYGGMGLTAFDAVLAIEEIAKVSCLAAYLVFELNVGPMRVIQLFGNEEQKKKYLPGVCEGKTIVSVGMTEPDAGSALTDLKTRAVLDGDHYIVNGEKRFVTGGGHSNVYMVYVRLSNVKGAKGIGGLIIEKGTPGFTFGNQEHFMGFKSIPSSDLIFKDCRVPKENLVIQEGGFKNLMQAFSIERLGNATMSLGLAAGALEESIKYSKQRKAYGKEICEFQAIQLMLAEMSMKVEAARLLIYKAAANASQGFPSVLESSQAKCYANEIAKEVTDMALQIHGGYGYSKEYPIERMLRDSRGWPVAGGTVQIQKINIASALIGRRFNQRK